MERITSKIHQQFRHNRLALFDDMNIIQTKKHIDRLYRDVFNIVKKEFTDILNPIYETIYDEAIDMGFDGDIRNLDEAWVEDFFEEYNPVTKYVFSNEIDRKKSRLFESLVASTLERHQSYKTAENLLIKQVKQYAIDLEDAIAMVVYEDTGVKMVMWNAEHDHRTCGDCSEMDGQIFKLKDVPDKLHYQCRCWLTPIME